MWSHSDKIRKRKLYWQGMIVINVLKIVKHWDFAKTFKAFSKSSMSLTHFLSSSFRAFFREHEKQFLCENICQQLILCRLRDCFYRCPIFGHDFYNFSLTHHWHRRRQSRDQQQISCTFSQWNCSACRRQKLRALFK